MKLYVVCVFFFLKYKSYTETKMLPRWPWLEIMGIPRPWRGVQGCFDGIGKILEEGGAWGARYGRREGAFVSIFFPLRKSAHEEFFT